MLLQGRSLHLAGYAATKDPGTYIIIVAEEGYDGNTVGYYSGTLDLGTRIVGEREAMERCTDAVEAFNTMLEESSKEKGNDTGGGAPAQRADAQTPG